MENLFIDMALATVEGIGLIASPCILPILPIFLSSSLTGSKRRPFGIIVGFVITFALFTYFSRKLVQYSGIDINVIRHLSFVILALLGIIMMSSWLSEKFSRLTRKLSNVGASSTALNNAEGGFFSGVLFGALIAFIWTPCAGPILAAVIVQTVLQKTTLSSFMVLISFALGASIPMLLIVIFGRFLMAKLTFFKQHSSALRKTLGAIILLSVGLMIYQDSFSTSTFSINSSDQSTSQTGLIGGVTPYPAPPIVGATGWINSPPLKLSDLKGKVVLIDFWTYSCINCVRTLPYVTGWYAKYHAKGLEIIGVHTPEFDFEKDLPNVEKAVIKYGIKYPVALDSEFGTWQSYDNKYWPAQYLINQKGMVVYQHFGEGQDDIMENNIRYLLGLNKVTDDTAISIGNPDISENMTPETYLGTDRAAHYSSPETITNDQAMNYTFPAELKPDQWALKGSWTIYNNYIKSSAADAQIKINFHAKHVYIVMGNATGAPIKVKVLYNGEAIVSNAGKDVNASTITVPDHELYEALSFDDAQAGILELTASAPGLEVYTFTFG
jgi:cytochrome c biogenesis protein CcdA/thiol-disulfide isomerase/thioredoxin